MSSKEHSKTEHKDGGTPKTTIRAISEKLKASPLSLHRPTSDTHSSRHKSLQDTPANLDSGSPLKRSPKPKKDKEKFQSTKDEESPGVHFDRSVLELEELKEKHKNTEKESDGVTEIHSDSTFETSRRIDLCDSDSDEYENQLEIPYDDNDFTSDQELGTNDNLDTNLTTLDDSPERSNIDNEPDSGKKTRHRRHSSQEANFRDNLIIPNVKIPPTTPSDVQPVVSIPIPTTVHSSPPAPPSSPISEALILNPEANTLTSTSPNTLTTHNLHMEWRSLDLSPPNIRSSRIGQNASVPVLRTSKSSPKLTPSPLAQRTPPTPKSHRSSTSKITSSIPTPPTSPITPTLSRMRHSNGEDDRIKLNIGGCRYETMKSTLCKNINYFTSLLSGKYPITRDKDGVIFINRPGKYFEPILEYLITDDVVVPEGLCTKALCREAAFYGIDFPLVEDHQSLSFVTDEWLDERFENRAYLKIASLADNILAIVLQQFKEKADKSLKIETSFLIHDLTPVEKWLDEREFGKEYWRFEFIDRQKKIYQKDCIVNDEYFALLDVDDNRGTIINYCKMHNLTVFIEPVRIHEPGPPGVVGKFYFTIGYKFIHVREEKKKKKRGSLHLEAGRITSLGIGTTSTT